MHNSLENLNSSHFSKKYFRITLWSILLIFTLFIPVMLNSQGDFETAQSNNQDQSSVPSVASISYNTRLYFMNINETLNCTHVIRGNNFTLRGYVQKFSNLPTPGFYNASGLDVFPILDGIWFDGKNLTGHSTVNLTTSSKSGLDLGLFEIDIPVNLSYAYWQDLTILANITDKPLQSIYVNQETVQNTSISLDVITETQISLEVTPTNPLMYDDSFSLYYNVTDNEDVALKAQGTGAAYPLSGLELYLNENITNVNKSSLTTNDAGEGVYTVSFDHMGWDSVGVRFANNSLKTTRGEQYYEYIGSFDSIALNRARNLTLFSLAVENRVNTSETADENELQYVYTGEDLRISGIVAVNNNDAYPLANRYVNITVNGTQLAQTLTAGTGAFGYTFNLEDEGFTENGTLMVVITLADFDDEFSVADFTQSFTISIIDEPPAPAAPEPTPIIPANPTNWANLIIPIGIIVGVIVGLVIFQRKRMDLVHKRDLLMRRVDKGGKMSIVTMLYNYGRKREAIAYTYKIYTDLINEKYSLQREPAQTLREFAIIVVTRYGQDPLRVYPYVAMIENVIYGAMEVNQMVFENAITLFGRLFQDITGSIMNLQMLNNNPQDIGEISIEISSIEESPSLGNSGNSSQNNSP